ncbi:hypothetical protein [Pelomonas sp. SE-A7]|uniref:hypothetical protein n=1 Tax=Pelomonas sp. SE-A7 TaxID=3054953 RepID=UPI00259CCEE0|nr:hypothetical protein [Pelomonas sp. SE-A7]MDM4768288.1 hypothetical protein [Pelomonas sp. SE-A7]
MRAFSTIASLATFMLVSAAAVAQDRPAAAASAAPAASMPMDCAGGKMKRHDHGAERGMPSAAAAPCAPSAASAASAPAKAKAKPLHDHAKVHKNQ